MAVSSRREAPLAAAEAARVAALLDFWFGAPGTAVYDRERAVWFERDADFDRDCGGFLADHERALSGAYDHWLTERDANLALILLLDQLSRNLFRDSPRAYAGDAAARRAARNAIVRGFDRRLPPVRRRFAYMPFMHSEALADQQRSVALFATMQDDPDNSESLDSARRHCKIIARFGRFPHRNAILGRATTPEEASFLADPDAAF
jgi:uncharacterized protein (DUF924 family)